jgi:adenylosuccinate lyase
MSRLFSPEHRARLFRHLWIALAKAEKNAGLAIDTAQIEAMQQCADQINWDAITKHEHILRHDVMAHIHAFGELCPQAKPIIHLGATSCFVTDNADLIIYRDALYLLLRKNASLLRRLSQFARDTAHIPTLGYTHFQPAQPTTVGKRTCLWLQDLLIDAHQLERLLEWLPFLGMKGATGTQASLLELVHPDRIPAIEQEIASSFGFRRILAISGQTYTRKIDIEIANPLASSAASFHKMATDLRLLAHEGELLEGKTSQQIGSSAMPHKRNPVLAERICGLARFALSLAQNPLYTQATQWLERSLDDSSNRRLALAELFLSLDALYNLTYALFQGLSVEREAIATHLEEAAPLLVMEPLLMRSAKRGADRQTAHEALRRISQLAGSSPERLAAALEQDRSLPLSAEDVTELLNAEQMTGLAAQQVDAFLTNEVAPFLSDYPLDEPRWPPTEI